ncbi:unnamed protein product [Rotaria magnacalcarata]|uniref:Uncharacterized protein n=1 Tax=Rotaria magnacalcarata TaxID=392030 RepID=A0A820FWH4_9BILA|nr:unnamed protein product [Rotaria magnacalcarata]CAF2219605.1 unnamed protein product [Rotaria magnacalcarata]CAF4252465.1 unnamed protein product [Rotaria magnacalcarata]CAF4270487.1 unnamed protein product [Rotaria magnacalcarata]
MGHHSSKHHDDHRRKPSEPWSTKTPGLPATKSKPSNSIQHYDLSNFAVITVIFNPVKSKNRYDHYRRFETHMSHSGVYLITVECIFESAQRFDLPRQNFEVTRAGDRRHMQLIAPSILWMKENLINIAVHRLPQNIEYVAWIDADIEFERLDWPHLAIAELQRYPIIQLFELSFFLGPDGKKDILRRDYSFGYSIRNNKPIDPQRYNEWYPHPGYAWAVRRSIFNSMGGLLDFCIIGSADLHFAYALLNRIEETLRPGLHPDYQKLAMIWGNRVAQVAQNGANVGYVPINLWHFWHGDRNSRNYVDRWLILERNEYSPINHLEKNDDTRLLRLADKKHLGHPEIVARIEALERDIVNYFKSRNEDDNLKRIPVQPPPIAKKTPFIANKTQTHRSNASKPTGFKSSNWRAGSGPHIWSSGPSGTHVDDHDPYLNQCTCPGNHHHDNHHCPCSSHYIDDQHCWNPSQHEDHHHHHHHHHHDDNPDHCYPSNEHHDHHPDHCSSVDHQFGHEHQSHGDSSNIDNCGYNYGTTSDAAGLDYTSSGGHDYSSGGGFTNTDYSGPGSFY